MIEIKDKEKCTGCSACYSICPKKCIDMKEDIEGFLYPDVDKKNCIECDLCEKVCPIFHEHESDFDMRVYACINKDEEVRKNSSSGGIFTLLAEYVLDNDGVVFGAAFDEDLNVHHIEVSKKSDLRLLRGSKYLQSRIEDTFKRAKKYLDENKYVLFSGTPCQIGGLKKYLKKDYDKLILQDLICHGAPSPLVWQKYLEFQAGIYNSEIDRKSFPQFRSKDKGWEKFSIFLKFTNGMEYSNTLDKDLFMKSFLKDICLRPSCYNCHFKSEKRESDITLADFWGVDKVLPEFFDDKGTSLVMINSKKGKKLFDLINDKMTYKAVKLEDILPYNTAALESAIRPKARNIFIKLVKKSNFEKAVDRCTNYSQLYSYLSRINNKLKRMCNHVQK